MADRLLSQETHDTVVFLTLNRPSVLNALNQPLRRSLADALAVFATDERLRVAVITGAGGRAFSVGADLKEMTASASSGAYGQGTAFPVPVNGPGTILGQCPKPVIAAVDGYCLAAGFELALECDIRIATDSSQFGLPEPRRGLLAGSGLHELARVVPLGEALRMQLTGAPIGAARAYQIGLVQELATSRDELMQIARTLADQIAQCGPQAVQSIKHVVRQGRQLPLEDAWGMALPFQQAAAQGGEAAEGTTAFVEKRRPRW